MRIPMQGFPRAASWTGVLVAASVLLGRIPSLSAQAPTEDPADRLWSKAMQATQEQAFDKAKAMLQLFVRKHPKDARCDEARNRISGNAFLCTVPLYVNGPKENRIDIHMSADGMTSSQKDQNGVARIVRNVFHDALRLHPFDVYWPYCNWTLVHCASKQNGINPREARETYDTCFGGMHGDKRWGGKDACMDFEYSYKTIVKPFTPHTDLFLVRVEGHNGWPPPWGIPMQVVGTSHMRYVPQIWSKFALDDGELPGYDLLIPRLVERFEKAWKEFQIHLKRERPKYRGWTVRQWRAWNAGRKIAINIGDDARDLRRRGVRERYNSFMDKKRYPDEMKVADRPLPEFTKLPWTHWLLKEEPSVTVYPLLFNSFYNTKTHDFRVNADGELELLYPGKPKKLEELKKKFGGRMPTAIELKREVWITYYAHDHCMLGAFTSKNRKNKPPQFCAVCREQTVLGIYRIIHPIDDYGPKEKALSPSPETTQVVFTVFPLKPLDHFLTVEWRVDGEHRKEGCRRRLLFRDKRGKVKEVKGVPRFRPQKRPLAYFDPATQDANVDRGLLNAALFHMNLKVEETFALELEKLDPGTHEVEVTVIDETPWVLWDPKEDLVRRVKWTVQVPKR
jgi:hypothetical protein